MDYRNYNVTDFIIERAIETYNRQLIVEHPVHGRFGVIVFDSVEYDGTHLTHFTSIGLPQFLTDQHNQLFRDIVDNLRRMRVRFSDDIEMVDNGFFSNRATMYTNNQQLKVLYQMLLNAGYRIIN